MGCDIHMHVEYKPSTSNENEEVKWLSGDYYRLDHDRHRNKYVTVDLWNDRNYWLFAVLADVRNDGMIQPIDGPRGLPSDISDDVKREYESWKWDSHSESYLTLQELIDFYEDYSDSMEGDILLPLISKLKDRADELNLIYNFSWKNNYESAYKDSAYIRIVFWFDN